MQNTTALPNGQTQMDTQNLFANIPEALDKELFDTLAIGSDLRIERIVSRGQSSALQEWYDQDSDEWVVLLRGAAVIAYQDGSEVTLCEGDYLHLPAHCRHRVQWTDPDRATVWLAIHYVPAVLP
jgi:cupin 2 domain-containing protein